MTKKQLREYQRSAELLRKAIPQRKEVLHLMTQDGQPYGSARRCCEECGVMIWGRSQPAWTDDRKLYANPPSQYVPCNETTP